MCAAVALTYCSAGKKASSATTASKTVPKKVTYQDNVAGIIAASCAPCHFPDKGGNKKPLDSYASVSGMADEVLRRIQLQPNERGFMPRQRPRLSDSTINVIKQWKADGLSEK